jgi:hypothetical protein
VYFRKSADIAKAHQSLANELEQVDDLIYTIGDHPIRPDQVSDNLSIDENLLRRILALYVTAGILRRERRRYCSHCDLLVDEHDDQQECDNCEVNFSQVKPELLEVFAPVNPVIRIEFDQDDDANDVASVCIQFVGGDRGGGQKNQLQVPKEYGSIKSAIKAAEYSDRLELADPVYAAKLEDLGTLYMTNPRLIHFAGHGDDRSLSFIQDQELLAGTVKVTANRIAKILQAYPARVSVVVFNTCHSAAMADDLAATGVVDITIGWEGKVSDSVAISFAQQFYTHICNGLSVGYAFVLASECAAPEDAAFRGALFTRSGVDPKTYWLLST